MGKVQRFRVTVGDREHAVELDADGLVTVDGEAYVVTSQPAQAALVRPRDATRQTLVHFERAPSRSGLPAAATVRGINLPVSVLSAQQARMLDALGASAAATSGTLEAPMPGRVVKILVGDGDVVAAGDPIIIVEAMKMENELQSPCDGTVRAIKVCEGDTVDAGQLLCELDPSEDSST